MVCKEVQKGTGKDIELSREEQAAIKKQYEQTTIYCNRYCWISAISHCNRYFIRRIPPVGQIRTNEKWYLTDFFRRPIAFCD